MHRERSAGVVGLFLVASVLRAGAQAPGTLVVVAGSGEAGFSGDGGPATAARLQFPRAVAVDRLGNLYIADWGNQRVRQISSNGVITTKAGTGQGGFSGDGGDATQAQLNGPNTVVVDAAGNLFIAETGDDRVRWVSPTGIISTVAGTGQLGFSGDGGAATRAQLYLPTGLALDAAGNLFIAEYGNQRVRRVSPDGTIVTVAGGGRTFGDGGLATNAQFNGLFGLATDTAGNLYISDQYDDRIRRVGRDGIITTVAGTGQRGFSGDGGQATAAQLNSPLGLALDLAGNLYIADWGNHRVRRVSPEGIITTIAGTGATVFTGAGGPATATGLRGPCGIAVDANGNLLFTDTANFSIGASVQDPSERVLKVLGVAAPGLIAGQPLPTGGVRLLVDPRELVFGKVAAGTISARSFVLANVGTSPINGNIGTLTAPFSVDGGGAFSLGPGTRKTVTVRFSPPPVSTLGEVRSTLTITSSDPTARAVNVPVSGEGISGGKLMLDASELSFGKTEVGKTGSLSLVIRNAGTGLLTGTVGTLAEPFTIVQGAGPFSRLPGEAHTVVVAFAPARVSDPGGFRTSLTITSSDPNTTTVNVPVAGESFGVGKLMLDATELSFGKIEVGTQQSRSLVMRNDGTGRFSGTVKPLAEPFSAAGGGDFALDVGATRTVTVQFAPRALGSFRDTLQITGADSGAAMLTVPVSGESVVVPRMVVEPTALAFDKVAVGTTQRLSLVLRNKGTGPLSGSVGALTEPFAVVDGGGSFSLGPTESRMVTVEFRPTRVSDAGGFRATLTITSDSPDAAMVNVSVVGQSVGAGRLELTPTRERGVTLSLTARDLVYGECADGTLVLQNTGTGPLTGRVESLQAPFGVVNGEGTFLLQPGERRLVVLRFCPPVGSLPSRSETKLVVTSSDREAPEVEVPVRVRLP